MAGFSKYFFNEGKDILNEKVKLVELSKNELDDAVKLIYKRYSIFSKDDHVVPYDILKDFTEEIKSEVYLMNGIGHMGNKSGLESLPEVLDIIINK